MSSSVNIFVASTPLNAILDSACAVDCRGINILFLIDQESHLSHQQERLLKILENKIFHKVILIGEKNSGLRGISGKKGSINKISSILESYEKIDNLYMSNDRRLENQYLVNRVIKDNGKVFYIDDGWYSYIDKVWVKSRFFSNVNTLVRKMIYGSWVYTVSRIAEQSYIKSSYLFYPELCAEYLNKRKNLAIARKNLESVIELLYPENLATRASKRCLILLPHSSTVTSGYEKYIPRGTDVNEICVKRHPRDVSLPETFKQFEEIDPTIPVECYFHYCRFEVVVCGASTTALSAVFFDVKKVHLPLNKLPNGFLEKYPDRFFDLDN